MTDFFIIGAAKSGTTTLYNWLKQQPGVFLPEVKEPHFFCFKGMTSRCIGRGVDPWFAHRMTFKEASYNSLFGAAQPGELRGDVSPGYLYFRHTAREIKAHNPDARIVCILRNPVERAFSQFMHHRRDGYEHFQTFADALAAEYRRKAEGWWWGYLYRDAGLYYERLKRYFESFDRSQILVIKHDYLSQFPAPALARIMKHIGAGDLRPVDFERRANKASQLPTVPRYSELHHLTRQGSKIDRMLTTVFATETRQLLRQRIEAFNSVPSPEFPMEIQEQLNEFYRSDILATEKLTGLCMRNWLHSKDPQATLRSPMRTRAGSNR